jgi:hypothetical protein
VLPSSCTCIVSMGPPAEVTVLSVRTSRERGPAATSQMRMMGLETTTLCMAKGRGFGPSDGQTRVAVRFPASRYVWAAPLKHANLRAIPDGFRSRLLLVPIELFPRRA